MASKTISLARAFTKRTKRNHETTTPTRGTSVKYPTGSINRDLISLPTELISTTNVHALTAPNIASFNGTGFPGRSNSDSDFSHIDKSFLDAPSLSADNSSIEESAPSTPVSSDDASAKGFFDSTPRKAVKTLGIRLSDSAPSLEAPPIPQRALSHSKKAHIELSRKRSIQRMSPPPNDLASLPSIIRNSTDPDHPFRQELAKVNEVAEDFCIQTSLDDEEQEMMSKGLKKFGVEDYLDEIAGLYGGIFEDQLGPMARPWI